MEPWKAARHNGEGKLSVLHVITSIQQHLSGIYIVIWGNYKDYMSGVYFYSKTWNVDWSYMLLPKTNCYKKKKIAN